MDDNRIIELLFERAENALDEVSHKYSRLYKGIIREVLSDECDVEECENDVLMAVWNTIPPNCPDSLSSYICKIANGHQGTHTRNSADVHQQDRYPRAKPQARQGCRTGYRYILRPHR